MQSVSMNDRQIREISDEIGKMLTISLDTETVRNKVNRLIADYLKKNNIDENRANIAKKISWSVEVSMKK